MIWRAIFFSILLFFSSIAFGEFIDDNIVVDLMNPSYIEGTLSTEEGGTVVGPTFRLQARKITYTKTKELCFLSAAGDLLLQFQGQFFRGDSFTYDFIHKTGTVCHAHSLIYPWSFGGETLEISECCDLILTSAFISPETYGENISGSAKALILTQDRHLVASGIAFNIREAPLFSLPKISIDLDQFEDFPFSVRFGWHGFMGSYVGLRYNFLTWQDFKAYARLDGYFRHGLGAGIETAYSPPCSPICFYTKNYYAHDLAIDDPEKRDRYRFQGVYSDIILNDSTSLDLIYDKVSDAEMASDYINDDFELETAERTELFLHREDCNFIANLFARVKLNSFQTINQELPSFELAIRPKEIQDTGIVVDNYFKASFLDFSFSDDVIDHRDFQSGRFELCPRIYRPFSFGPFNLTPAAKAIGIYYTNNRFDEQVGQGLFDLSLEGNCSLYRHYYCVKHVIEPYAAFHYLTPPRSALDAHYLFTMADAYDTLKILRFGTRHILCAPCCNLPLTLDLFTNAFFDTKAMGTRIQKIYLEAELDPTPTLCLTSLSGYNIEENLLDFTNNRADWTLSENLALGVEWRHRSAYDWRKADFYDFLLESVRMTDDLLVSPLSDRNDILLFRVFYRLTPNFTTKFELREGWHRLLEPAFTEYQIEATTPIFENFRLAFIFEKKETDNRYLIKFFSAPGPF